MTSKELHRQNMKGEDRKHLTFGDYVIVAFVLLVIFSFIFHQPLAEMIFRVTK